MERTIFGRARRAINSALRVLDVELVRIGGHSGDYRAYIPCQATVDAARRAGLSVGDYIDSLHNVPGATEDTIRRMHDLGVFDHRIDRVCEIGPGSGRYLEAVRRACQPGYYEIYETAPDWAAWLVGTYDVVQQQADGRSLAATPDGSIDLVHTHKVLPGQPSLVIFGYLLEMARVVRRGGKVVFDIVSEECLGDGTLHAWLASGASYQHYPCVAPKQFTVDLLCQRGFSFDGSFQEPMRPGTTDYLVFTKTALSGS